MRRLASGISSLEMRSSAEMSSLSFRARWSTSTSGFPTVTWKHSFQTGEYVFFFVEVRYIWRLPLSWKMTYGSAFPMMSIFGMSSAIMIIRCNT
jgi:hypothetical protein